MRIANNWIYFEPGDLHPGITMQGIADMVAPHFAGDNAMHHYVIRGPKERFVLYYNPKTSVEEGVSNMYCSLNGWGKADDLLIEAVDDQEWYSGA